MSYQDKYLKYKSKYLQLKALKQNLEQLGGARNYGSRRVQTSRMIESEDNFLNMNTLTETPVNEREFKQPRKVSKKSRKSKNSESDLVSSSTDSSDITNSFSLSSSDESL